MHDQRERPDGAGRVDEPLVAAQVAAEHADRDREPAAAGQPRRVRRRRPADSKGDLHPRRANLPGPDQDVGGWHPHDRTGIRQLDGRRRLRPWHERLRGDDRAAVEGVPRRAAARQDGNRRRIRRRIARRREHARPPVRSRRLPRQGRARRAADRPVNRRQAEPARTRRRKAVLRPGRPAARPGRTARHRARGSEGSLRPAGGHRPDRRRLGLRRVQTAVRQQPGHGVGRPARLPDRHTRQRSRDLVQRGIPEGGSVHPASEPGRRAAPVPAEHDRLHGRRQLRASGNDQARGHDDQRGLEQPGAAPDDRDGRLLRRGELRHVRTRLRPEVPVHLAERQVGGDGPGPACRGAVDRGTPVGGRPGRAVRRGRRRRDAGDGGRADRGGVAGVLPVRTDL